MLKYFFPILLIVGIVPTNANQLLDQHQPIDMTSKTWNSLKSTINKNKLLPSPSGIGGDGSSFGFSVSAENNRVLIGAKTVLNTGVVYVFDLIGEDWIESAVLIPSNLQYVNSFGNSVSLSGNQAIIGAVNSFEYGFQSGAAYIFEFVAGQWVESQKLMVPNLEQNDKFGTSVSLSGNTALVGAVWDDDKSNDSGAVYVFNKIENTWVNTVKLSVNNGKYFGVSVSLDGNKALIGADGSLFKGLAYIYEYDGNTWQLVTTLTASDGINGDSFGKSVSLLSNRAVIGAPFNSSSGVAYVFELDNSNWVQTQKLVPVDGVSGDLFGISVSQSLSGILIGAIGDNDNGARSGSVYIFEKNNGIWTQNKIIASNGMDDYKFGRSVFFNNNDLIVGSPGTDAENFSGLVYVYKKNAGNWLEYAQLNSIGAALDNFGKSTSIHGDIAIVGAPYDDENGNNTGAVYIFENTGGEWVNDIKISASDGKNDDEFGSSISVFNNWVIVGVSQGSINNINTGSVYVYDKDSNWSEEKIFASDGLEYDRFGHSIDIFEQFIIVGAPLAANNDVRTGAAYIYQYKNDQWLETKIFASDGSHADFFGTAVGISGKYAIVSSSNDDDVFNDSGSAYVFEFSNGVWNEIEKLTPSDSSSNIHFGRYVDISGNFIAIGSLYSVLGAVYVFELENNTWFETFKIIGTDIDNQIGKSFSIFEKNLLVGASSANSQAGSAFIYKRNGLAWEKKETIVVQDGDVGDAFGTSLSSSEDYILIGSPGDDDRGTGSGSAYIFIHQMFANGFEH